jgi:hypothetical protein
VTPEEARQTARFLRAHPPFDSLAADEVERVAASAEMEGYVAGDVVFDEGAPVHHLRVLRSGTIELTTRGKILDVLAEGDVFGHGSLLSGLPTAFNARAVEDSTCYRIPADEARAILSGPTGVQFVARSLLEEPTELHILAREPAVNAADQPVGSLVRGEPVVCAPATTIREAALLMSAGHGTSVVVDLGPDGGPGHERGRAGDGGDVGARLHHHRRPAGRRGAGRDVRTRTAPLPGAVRDRRDRRRGRGCRPGVAADAIVVLAAPAARHGPLG